MNRRIVRWSAITATMLVATVVTAVAAYAVEPSPAQIRECVERNAPRYENPGSAVVAQYSDVETTCRAMLDEGDVGVAFVPSGSGDRGSAAAAAGGGDEGGRPPGLGPEPTRTGQQAPPPPRAEGSRRATRDPVAPMSSSPTNLSSVARAIEGDEGAGSPVPSSLAAGPIWLYALLGGIAVGVGAAAVMRRPR
jgi:hypothetical protein